MLRAGGGYRRNQEKSHVKKIKFLPGLLSHRVRVTEWISTKYERSVQTSLSLNLMPVVYRICALGVRVKGTLKMGRHHPVHIEKQKLWASDKYTRTIHIKMLQTKKTNGSFNVNPEYKREWQASHSGNSMYQHHR